jgi:uncharacterized protein (TIGR00266 family)
VQAEVKGGTMPVLEVLLDPGEAVVSDRGELSWMSANMRMSQTASTGTDAAGGGLMAGLKRAIGGGSLLLTRFEPAEGTGMVAFAAKLPGHIVPLTVAPGQAYLVHRHGSLCGTPGITPTMAFQQSLGGMLLGGEGFVLQRLEGTGTAWIELSGELTSYRLAAGQQLVVHPGHIGAFADTVQFQVTRMPGIVNRWAGGDGHWVVVLTGPGQVWLQSMPLPILAAALQPYLGGATSDAVAGGAVGGVFGSILGR